VHFNELALPRRQFDEKQRQQRPAFYAVAEEQEIPFTAKGSGTDKTNSGLALEPAEDAVVGGEPAAC
jgi:hypothetical protein